MPPEIVTNVPPFPPRPADGHKGTFGSLLIIGGSETMLGAPVLAARAAYRSGCGLVRIAVPDPMLPMALASLPEAIGVAADGLDEAMAASDAIVCGPGLGGGAEAVVEQVVAAAKPVVLDADALNAIARSDSWPVWRAPAVLTPHPGEMRRLLRHVPGHVEVSAEHEKRIRLAHDAAVAAKAIVLLKGRQTVIADGDRVFVNTTGDVTLAKAGSGDVLAGVVGALLAGGMAAFKAACLGAHSHGSAGEAVGRRRGTHGGLASEVADAVADVI
jgi:NAD(P)H-hydrate epimerase